MSQVRRNDNCPCGSGKKYKNCCAKTEAKLVQRRHEGLKARALSHSSVSPLQAFSKKIFKAITDVGQSDFASQHTFTKGLTEKKSQAEKPHQTLEGLIGLDESKESSIKP